MDTAHYAAMMADAFSKLEKLHRDREVIDGEIMKIEQLIAATANMLPDEVRDLAMQRMTVFQELNRLRDVGLTDAIRAILRQADGEWLTVTNVRDHLIKAGFDFSNYSTNPLASVSAVLRRMKPEEVESTTVDGGVAAYRWKDRTHNLAKKIALKQAMENSAKAARLPTLTDTIEAALNNALKKK